MKFDKIMLLALTAMSSTAYADCKAIDIKTGWTGSISLLCDRDTNLTENPIQFEVNGAKVWQTTSDNNQDTTRTRTDGGVTSVEVRSKMDPKDEYIQPSIIKTNVPFKLNIYASESDYTIDNVRVAPLSKGVVSLRLPPKPASITSESLPIIQIFVDGDIYTTITKAKWGSIRNIEVVVGNGVNIEVRALPVDGVEGFVSNSNFSLHKGETVNTNISYGERTYEVGSIKVSYMTDNGTLPSVNVPFEVIDSNGKVVAVGDILRSAAQTVVDNLKPGKYTIKADNFKDLGYTYQLENQPVIEVTAFNTVSANLKFIGKKEQEKTEIVSVTVSGFGEKERLKSGNKVHLVLSSDNGYYKDIVRDRNGTSTFVVPKGTYKLSASDVDYYRPAVFAPSNVFVVNQSSVQIGVHYEKANKFDLKMAEVPYDKRAPYAKIMFDKNFAPKGVPEEVSVEVKDPENNNCAVRIIQPADNAGGYIWKLFGYGNGTYKFTPHAMTWNGGITLVSYDCPFAGKKDSYKDADVEFTVTHDDESTTGIAHLGERKSFGVQGFYQRVVNVAKIGFDPEALPKGEPSEVSVKITDPNNNSCGVYRNATDKGNGWMKMGTGNGVYTFTPSKDVWSGKHSIIGVDCSYDADKKEIIKDQPVKFDVTINGETVSTAVKIA